MKKPTLFTEGLANRTNMGYTLFCNIDAYDEVGTGIADLIPTRISKSDPNGTLVSDMIRTGANGISWVYVNHGTKGHISNPSGGNITYTDGHVAWNPWSKYNKNVYLRARSNDDIRYYAW